VVGILGSSHIEAPLELGVAVREVAFSPDQQHAIVASPDASEALVVNLEEPSRSWAIAGVPSSVSSIRISEDGKSAALFDTESNKLILVNGLPGSPKISNVVAVALEGHPLRSLAISPDGSVVLLAFAGETADSVYSWTPPAGLHFVTDANKVSDLVFISDDAVLADAGSNEVFLLRSIRDQAAPLLIADSRDGLEQPSALSISSRNEIFIGSGHAILVMDAAGHALRRVECGCTVTRMAPMRESALQLTDSIDDPVFVLDGGRVPEQILFIPALSRSTPAGGQ
jgi:hypothetical protein